MYVSMYAYVHLCDRYLLWFSSLIAIQPTLDSAVHSHLLSLASISAPPVYDELTSHHNTLQSECKVHHILYFVFVVYGVAIFCVAHTFPSIVRCWASLPAMRWTAPLVALCFDLFLGRARIYHYRCSVASLLPLQSVSVLQCTASWKYTWPRYICMSWYFLK